MPLPSNVPDWPFQGTQGTLWFGVSSLSLLSSTSPWSGTGGGFGAISDLMDLMKDICPRVLSSMRKGKNYICRIQSCIFNA